MKDGLDAAANEGIGHPGELAVAADVAGACEFARLLMDEEEFEILRTRLAEGPNVVICRGVPREPLVPVLPGVPLHPGGPGGVERVQGGLVAILDDEVPLDEAARIRDLPRGPGPAGVVELDPEATGEVLVLGLPVERVGFELAPPIREQGPGEPPLPERRMEHHADMDLVLVEEPAPGQEEAAAVTLHQDQEEIPEQGEVHLPLDVELP